MKYFIQINHFFDSSSRVAEVPDTVTPMALQEELNNYAPMWDCETCGRIRWIVEDWEDVDNKPVSLDLTGENWENRAEILHNLPSD